jgi:NADH:ubiquinone reductase (H+-translocating)
MSGPVRVVIVGGGFGGLYAARALASAPVTVTLVDRFNHHVFQPLLYQVATAGLSPGDIASPIRTVLRRQRNARVILGEVTGIDVAARTVSLHDETVPYDYLVLASGARHSYFAHPEWERLAPGLKTLQDALAIRRLVLLAFERAEREPDPARREALLTFVIVGGGPTGVELAGAIAEIARRAMARDFRVIDPRRARVVLVEAGPRLLPAFPESLSARAGTSLARIGVEVLTGAPVTQVEVGAVVVGGTRLPAAVTLWAAGVAPSPLGRSLGAPLARAGRVLVGPDLTIPGHPEVFVVGDLAACADGAGRPLPGLAPVAIQQGRHAARNVRRACRGERLEAFRYRDRGMLATIGRAQAVAALGRLRVSGLLAWWAWLTVHIFWLIGFRNRFVVLVDWAVAYLTWQRSARLIIAEVDAPEPATRGGS